MVKYLTEEPREEVDRIHVECRNTGVKDIKTKDPRHIRRVKHDRFGRTSKLGAEIGLSGSFMTIPARVVFAWQQAYGRWILAGLIIAI